MKAYTESERQALIERCKKHLDWHERLGFRGAPEEDIASIHRIALAILEAETGSGTQPSKTPVEGE